MRTDRDYYLVENARVTITLDLFRRGTASSPRLNKVRFGDDRLAQGLRNDVTTFEVNGEPWVRARDGGVSTFDAPAPGGHWWRLPAGTELPEEVVVVRDHATPDGRTHYTLAPSRDMAIFRFIAALERLHARCVRV